MKPMNHYVGPARIVPSIFESAPNRTMKDFEDQIARLRATPKMVNGIIAAANERLRRRIQSPARTAQLLLPLLEAQTRADAAQNPLLKAFRQMPASISQQDRERLTNDAAKAYEEAFRPAWRKLREYVSSTYIPRTRTTLGLSQNFNGAELYQSMIRGHTTTRLTARQIHDIGLREIERIQNENGCHPRVHGFYRYSRAV